MRPFTYLLIDFFTIIIPFAFSFHPKLKFSKKWPYFFPGLLIAAVFFLIWDSYFTKIGVWGFNEEYLLGISILNLPIEEVLFFICIPYACVFTFHCFGILGIQPISPLTGRWISIAIVLLSGITLFLHLGKHYTTSTFFLLMLSVVYLQWIRPSPFLPRFYFAYFVLLLPFAITNGLLTGSFIENEVVWYNDQENIGFRLGTIPFEDIFYGMLLILWNVSLLDYFERKNQSKSSGAG